MLPYDGGVCASIRVGTSAVELWAWPDDAARAFRIASLQMTGASDPSPSMAILGSTLYFPGTSTASGNDIQVIELASPGGSTDLDVVPGPDGSYPTNLTAIDGAIYFSAMSPEHGREPWRIVGGVPSRLSDVRSGPAGSGPADFIGTDRRVYFTADDGEHGRELWTYDQRTGACSLVKDIYPAQSSHSPHPTEFALLGDVLLFDANDGVNGTELWRTEGTPDTTEMLKDIYGGHASSGPSQLTVVGDRVFFRAEDPNKGIELFVTDGTSLGTKDVEDLVPGPAHATGQLDYGVSWRRSVHLPRQTRKRTTVAQDTTLDRRNHA